MTALKFLNAGQACIGANRIYVQSSIYDEVGRRMADHARQMTVGDGSQSGVVMGPLVDMKAVEKVAQQTKNDEGACPKTK